MMEASAATDNGTLVIGAGAVGSAVARALALRGVSVTVVDRDDPGARATWAAGGMLSPLGEAPAPGPFLRLALRSMELYPALVRGLEAESDREIGFARGGKLLVVRDRGLEALERRRRWQEAEGFDVRAVTGAEARELEPALADDVRAGLLLPTDGWVDNRALGEALRRSARAAGCRFVKGDVVAVASDGGRVSGIRLADESTRTASRVVVAAGAWSGRLEGLPRALPVRPVRGQMLAYGDDAPRVDRVIGGPDVYLIPRIEDGRRRLVVGATQEEAGFDLESSPRDVARLRSAAEALLPGLQGVEPVESWAGLRPGTPDDLPILGPDPGMEGLVHATGHFRNGILLTPVTAELLSRAILDGEAVPPELGPLRFSRPEGNSLVDAPGVV